MDVKESVRALGRHWFLTLLLLALTVVAAYKLYQRPGPYQAESQVALLPSKQNSKLNGGNPYLSFGGALTTTADLVRREISQPTFAHALKTRGYVSSYQVVDDPNTAGPVLDITVTGKSKPAVEHTLAGVTAAAGAELSRMQGPLKKYDRISMLTVSYDPKASLVLSKKARTPIVVLAVGLVLTIAIPLMLDAALRRRRIRDIIRSLTRRGGAGVPAPAGAGAAAVAGAGSASAAFAGHGPGYRQPPRRGPRIPPNGPVAPASGLPVSGSGRPVPSGGFEDPGTAYARRDPAVVRGPDGAPVPGDDYAVGAGDDYALAGDGHEVPVGGFQDLESGPAAPDYGSAPADHGAPVASYGTPVAGYGGPAGDYVSPAEDYVSPAEGYGAPAEGYGAPAGDYVTPAEDYVSPAEGYGTPAEEYGAPADYGASAEDYVTAVANHGAAVADYGSTVTGDGTPALEDDSRYPGADYSAAEAARSADGLGYWVPPTSDTSIPADADYPTLTRGSEPASPAPGTPPGTGAPDGLGYPAASGLTEPADSGAPNTDSPIPAPADLVAAGQEFTVPPLPAEQLPAPAGATAPADPEEPAYDYLFDRSASAPWRRSTLIPPRLRQPLSTAARWTWRAVTTVPPLAWRALQSVLVSLARTLRAEVPPRWHGFTASTARSWRTLSARLAPHRKAVRTGIGRLGRAVRARLPRLWLTPGSGPPQSRRKARATPAKRGGERASGAASQPDPRTGAASQPRPDPRTGTGQPLSGNPRGTGKPSGRAGARRGSLRRSPTEILTTSDGQHRS
jgi:hypothetical protein